MSIICVISASGQIYNPDKPMIREFVICADSINSQLKKYQSNLQTPLPESNGSVQIPNSYYIHNGKSNGIIVVRTQSYAYLAYDARCAHCFYDEGSDTGKVKMVSCLAAKCPECGAEVHKMVLDGSGQMCRYDDELNGYVYLDAYDVDVVKIRGKTYLIISNAPNGRDEDWIYKKENQPLLENGRPYRHPIRNL